MIGRAANTFYFFSETCVYTGNSQEDGAAWKGVRPS
jgi:hypothetical protein